MKVDDMVLGWKSAQLDAQPEASTSEDISRASLVLRAEKLAVQEWIREGISGQGEFGYNRLAIQNAELCSRRARWSSSGNMLCVGCSLETNYDPK
jgi:hypothetical protein